MIRWALQLSMFIDSLLLSLLFVAATLKPMRFPQQCLIPVVRYQQSKVVTILWFTSTLWSYASWGIKIMIIIILDDKMDIDSLLLNIFCSSHTENYAVSVTVPCTSCSSYPCNYQCYRYYCGRRCSYRST